MQRPADFVPELEARAEWNLGTETRVKLSAGCAFRLVADLEREKRVRSRRSVWDYKTSLLGSGACFGAVLLDSGPILLRCSVLNLGPFFIRKGFDLAVCFCCFPVIHWKNYRLLFILFCFNYRKYLLPGKLIYFKINNLRPFRFPKCTQICCGSFLNVR